MKLISLFFMTFAFSIGFASVQKSLSSSLRYKTYFGECPSKSAGSLVLKLIENFEKHNSLGHIKKKIVKEKLDEKYFIDKYSIAYDPFKNYLNFKFSCPEATFKVSVYKPNGETAYSAILTSKGSLIDPVYESLLRSEDKITNELPSLAIPISHINDKNLIKYINIFHNLDPKIKKNVSEVIIKEDKNITVIVSLKGKTSSIFLGNNFLFEKISKLNKILVHLSDNKKVPTLVNLTNLKKVVVKFSDTI